MDLSDLVSMLIGALIGALVGGAITWFVSRYHYVRAAKELSQEAAKLRRLSTMVLRSLENAGLAELNRDASGEIIGLVLRSGAQLTATASLSAKAEVVRRESGNHGMTEANDAGRR